MILNVVVRPIHRHIGGLEKRLLWPRRYAEIHRHIGGLEKIKIVILTLCYIHRHIGGLEIGHRAFF